MGLPDSSRLSRVRPYSGAGSDPLPFRVQDFHLLWSTIPDGFRWGTEVLTTGPTTPPGRVQVVWADPLSLAATDGVAFAFLSSGY